MRTRMAPWRLAHLPVLLGVSGGLLLVAAVVGWLLRGWPGAAGAAAGVGIVVTSYLVSTLAIAWAETVELRLVLPVGLLAYVVKFTVIGMVMAALTARGWDGLEPLGVGVVAGVVVWTATQIWWVVRNQPRLEYHYPHPEDGTGDHG